MSDSTRRQDELTDEVIRWARGCPPAEELVAYHDGALGAGDGNALEGHVSDCASCRAALEYLGSDAAQEPGNQPDMPRAVEERSEAGISARLREGEASARVPAWMKLAAGVILAATLATMGYLWWSPTGFDEDLGGFRSDETLLALDPSGAIDAPPDRFHWTAHPMARSYAVSLFDEGMNEIWEGRTQGDDTDLSPDAAARELLAAGGPFSWQVFALDGTGYGFDQSSIVHFEISAASSTR